MFKTRLQSDSSLCATCSGYKIKENRHGGWEAQTDYSRGVGPPRTGVNIETIRYFETIGVLATPERTEGGHRIYEEGHVRTLGFVRRARNLGFTPQEVRAILALGGPGSAGCVEVRTIAEHHLKQVRAKLADLIELERLLTGTVEHCSGKADPECAVMDLIEESTAADTAHVSNGHASGTW